MANLLTAQQLEDMCFGAARLGFRPERLMLLDRVITGWVEQRRVAQAMIVKVTRGGETAFEAAYGQRGLHEEEGPMALDTIVALASITKTVTATLMCILQEEGLLELTQRVRPHYPPLSGDTGSDIRLWQLLTHTSGLSDEAVWEHIPVFVREKLELTLPADGAPAEEQRDFCLRVREKMNLPDVDDEWLAEDTWDWLRGATPPSHPPHTVMAYCNEGYQIAGRILSRLTGKSLDELAREKIFDPLGMPDTHFRLPDEKIPRYYRRSARCLGHEWLNNERAMRQEGGGGGIKSTVSDICRFVEMFLNEGALDGVRILSRQSVRMMLTDHNGKLPSSFWNGEHLSPAWGLGWNIRGDKFDDAGMVRGPRAFDHGAYAWSKITGDPAKNVAVAVFNSQPADSDSWNWGAGHINNMVLGALCD